MSCARAALPLRDALRLCLLLAVVVWIVIDWRADGDDLLAAVLALQFAFAALSTWMCGLRTCFLLCTSACLLCTSAVAGGASQEPLPPQHPHRRRLHRVEFGEGERCPCCAPDESSGSAVADTDLDGGNLRLGHGGSPDATGV
eukprot:Hpha_TRINITY_DN32119_c0_g1::TRINITY_DN32119_c0_g1_i1::g.18390::m.18390